MTKNAILEAAMKLSPRQRGELADRLFSSLNRPADKLSQEEWITEIQRRVDEARAGKGKSKPLSKVLSDVRKKYSL